MSCPVATACLLDPNKSIQENAKQVVAWAQENHGMSPYLKRSLELLVWEAMEWAARDTWKAAQKEVSACCKHYPGEQGDPAGCLIGLACEFSAKAEGKGPKNT